jgi:hypothetical protein
VTTFQPRLSTLPQAQRQLWAEFVSLPRSFVLYGGTALALRTGSRLSEDFDFFANETLDAHRLAGSLSWLQGAELIQAEPNTATYLIDRGGRVKVSFFGGLGIGRVGVPDRCADTGVAIASLLDIAAQKVRVVQVRAEQKDYLDVATLLEHGVALHTALGAALALYPDFSPMVTLKALAYFGDGDLSQLPEQVRMQLTAAAVAVTNPALILLKSTRLSAEE